MCASCGCNYPTIDHPMSNAKGDNSMDVIKPVPSSIVKASPKKPKK